MGDDGWGWGMEEKQSVLHKMDGGDHGGQTMEGRPWRGEDEKGWMMGNGG